MKENLEEKRNRRRSRDASKEKQGIKSKCKKTLQLNINWDRKKITVLLIVAIIIAVIVVMNNYVALGLVINKNINSKDAIQIELQGSNNKIIPFGSEVLVYNKGTIEIYNSNGKNTGKIVIDDTIDAEILTAGQYIQVINKDKDVVYIYKNKYENARIKIDGEIYSGNINSDGMSVIEYSHNGNKRVLGIYDNKGNIKYNVKLNNNIIGKYELSKNSKYLAYVDVNVAGISAQTNINLIDLSSVNEEKSGMDIIYTKDNSLAYDLYWSGNNVIVRFEQNYIIYNISSKKTQNIEISKGQLLNVGDYDKRYAYVELNQNGDYTLGIRKMSTDRVKQIQISDTPKYFKYENGIAYVCYSNEIEAYNNLGVKIKNYNSDIVVTEPTIFNNGRSLVMAVSNKLIMFTI